MIKLFEMFAGYGGASFGLQKVNIPFECIGYSEIDKGAIKCYEQNHKGKNYGDCSKIDVKELPDFDLLTGGFPCQDVSIAGNRDLSKGRTNLYLEILRIAKAKKPKYILLENVKGLLSVEVDERKLHLKIVSDLEKLGYGVAWKVLNSKDYGIPQNRERIWFVCKLGGWDFMEFMFPEKEELRIFVKDILEEDVLEKYYLSEKAWARLSKRMNMEKEGIIGTITASSYKQNWNTPLTNTNLVQFHNENEIRQYGQVAPTLIPRTMEQNVISFSEKTRDVEKAIEFAKKLSEKENKPVQLDLYHLQHGEIRPLSTYIPQNLDEHRCLQTGKPKEVLIYKNTIRRLTPKECFRLMGFLNDEINLNGLSDTQCYKLAGNGWDINLVSKIFKRMFK
jgi:DNA (cytosine-5)-methyltransferase 1